MQIHSPGDFREVPWRNGRGSTLLLLSEAIPGCDAFVWRLSMAGVDNDGPFSCFDDCDRILILLDGRGITLTHSNRQVDTLCERLALARFPGDAGTVAALHDGPVRDFNVIWHRRHCKAEVIVLDGARNELLADGGLLLVYAVDRDIMLHTPSGTTLCIGHRQLLQYDDAPPGRWVSSGGPAIAVKIRRLPDAISRPPT